MPSREQQVLSLIHEDPTLPQQAIAAEIALAFSSR